VKRTRGHKPVGVAIYICMQTSQGISLCSYCFLQLTTTLYFSSYLLSSFSTKSKNRRVEQVLQGGAGVGTNGREEVVGRGYKGKYGANNVYT
jgi:hypothetical protein